MRSASMVSILGCSAALALAATAIAQSSAEGVTGRLQARAEAPPEPITPRPELLDVPVAERLFYMRATDHVRCVRSVPDVTGDGRDEVVVGIDESQADNIFCLDGASSGEATVVWTQHPISGVSNGSPYGDDSIVPISDLDGNGYSNILVGTAWGGRSAHNLDSLAGAILWTFDTYLEPDSGWVYSLAELSDVTGDGVPEVAFGAGSFNDTVFLVDGASTAPGQATVVWKRQMTDAVVSVRNIGDVNGDGDDDVLLAVGDNGYAMVCMDGGSTSPTGAILWQYPAGTSVYAVGVLPDITGDGVNEALAVVWTVGGGAIRCVNGATGGFLWASTQVPEYGMMVDILDDVTGDGFDDIVVASWENAVIVLNGLNGELVWKTTVGTLNGGDVWTARAIDDLNGDGNQDVIAGSFDTNVYAMSGKTGAVLWTYPTGYRVYSVYPVGDLTGDGIPEVAVGNQNLSGASLEVVHVLDGGAAWPAIFDDGFESGDTGGWSGTGP